MQIALLIAYRWWTLCECSSHLTPVLATRLWKRWVAAMRKQEDCYSDLKSESRAVSQLLHACMGEYGCRVMYLVAVKVWDASRVLA